ncbi:MAG: transglutaminase domain-containing protein [Wujia sp.]
MERDGNKVFVVVPVFVVVVIAVYYFFGWQIGAYFNKDNTVYSYEELITLVNEQIDEGKSGGKFYVKNVSEEEIAGINNYVCGMNGDVLKYSILETTKSGMRVSITYQISDNYYVYERFTNQSPIPADRPMAQKLYEEVDTIMAAIITEGMNDYEKEIAIHDYIVMNCEYGYIDYSKENAYTAYGCLVQKKAVCNGYAEAMALLLSCAGVENDMINGTADGELHSWNQVKLDDKWYHVDATWDDPLPDKKGYVRHQYFNVSDEIMDNDHQWDEDSFFNCNSMIDNYFEKNQYYTSTDRVGDFVLSNCQGDMWATIEVLLTDCSSLNDELVFHIPGIDCYSYSIQEYGDYDLATIYLNQKY